MRWYLHKLAMMFGAAPRRPSEAEETDAAREMKKFQKLPEETRKRRALIEKEKEYPLVSNKWKYARWTSIAVINLMFVVSFAWDVQLVEGALTASRFLGFHMADPTAALQVTFHEGADVWPRWSPDGRRIAFGSDRSGSLDIWIVDLEKQIGDALRAPLSAASSTGRPTRARPCTRAGG